MRSEKFKFIVTFETVDGDDSANVNVNTLNFKAEEEVEPEELHDGI